MNSKVPNIQIISKTSRFSKTMLITIFSTIFQASMAFLATILYIVNTYYSDDKEMYFNYQIRRNITFSLFARESTFILLETLIGVVFLLDYLWNFSHSEDKVQNKN